MKQKSLDVNYNMFISMVVGNRNSAGWVLKLRFIFDECGREYHAEGLRREDLIREGTFIGMANQRSKNAAGF